MNARPDKSSFDRKIDQFFWNTRNALGPNFDDVLASLGMSKKMPSPHQLPVTKLLKILDRLNVTLDALMQENIDFDCMKQQLKGENGLPGRYFTKGPLSPRYTSVGMMNFIIKELGKDSSEVLMKHFQLTPEHFEDPKYLNNFLLPMDLCNYIFKYFGEEMVEQMGEDSVGLLASSPAGAKMKSLRCTKEMFEFLLNEVAPNSIERNYFWKIEKHKQNTLLLSGTPNPEIREAFGNEEGITLPSATLQRKGFIKGLFHMKDHHNLCIETTRTLRSNKMVDLYHVEYHGTSYH